MKICSNCKLLLRKNKMDISIVFGFVFEDCSKLSFTDKINCAVGVIGLVLSVIAIYVSIRTARHQKKVDLFDKRFKIYSYLNTCYEACKNVVNNYNLDGFMLISVLDLFYFSLSRTYSNIYSDMFHKNIEVGRSANLTQLEIDKKSTDVKQLENRLLYEKESINVDYISILEKCLGKEAEKVFLPMQPGDVYQTYAEVDELINDFNFRPSTSIEEGLGKFATWFKEYYKDVI